jgi:hypothetical protein
MILNWLKVFEMELLEQFLERIKFRMEFIVQIWRKMELMIVISFSIFFKDNNYNIYYTGSVDFAY